MERCTIRVDRIEGEIKLCKRKRGREDDRNRWRVINGDEVLNEAPLRRGVREKTTAGDTKKRGSEKLRKEEEVRKWKETRNGGGKEERETRNGGVGRRR